MKFYAKSWFRFVIAFLPLMIWGAICFHSIHAFYAAVDEQLRNIEADFQSEHSHETPEQRTEFALHVVERVITYLEAHELSHRNDDVWIRNAQDSLGLAYSGLSLKRTQLRDSLNRASDGGAPSPNEIIQTLHARGYEGRPLDIAGVIYERWWTYALSISLAFAIFMLFFDPRRKN